jgi:DNA-binding CsgD family transcriptional regulator
LFDLEEGRIAMFESLLQQLVSSAHGIRERSEGVAFLKVAKSSYPIHSATYIGLNIPVCPNKDRFVQCTLADDWVKQGISKERIPEQRLAGLARVLQGPLDWAAAPEDSDGLRKCAGIVNGAQIVSFPLRKLDGESAFFCIDASITPADWPQQKDVLLQDFQVLGNYFHQHMMRIYGHDASREILVTVRELDCLKWMAAGKTAWEVSVILGISERTVRFHLNAAREKLDCLTTTQAVAKAVSQQLISP